MRSDVCDRDVFEIMRIDIAHDLCEIMIRMRVVDELSSIVIKNFAKCHMVDAYREQLKLK